MKLTYLQNHINRAYGRIVNAVKRYGNGSSSISHKTEHSEACSYSIDNELVTAQLTPNSNELGAPCYEWGDATPTMNVVW